MSNLLVRRIGDSAVLEILEKDQGDLWCAIAFINPGSTACYHFKPEFETFAQKMKNVYCAEIVADENPSLMERLGIKSVPTMIMLFKGQVKWRCEGPYSYEFLSDRISQLIRRTS